MRYSISWRSTAKCEFGLTEILYLGYVIGIGGVKVHQEKIHVILDWPPPKNISNFKVFMDLFALTTGGSLEVSLK